MFATLKDMFNFLVSKRKFWLIPIIFMLIVIGGLFIAVQGSVLAPFIYTLF
jgi:hypothetical protein